MGDQYRRNLIILVAAVLALAIFFIAGSIIQSGRRSFDPGGIEQFISEDANIRRILVNDEISLEQENETWTVNGCRKFSIQGPF